jgi:hypothetical protein
MASERDRWIDVELDDEDEEAPASAADDASDDDDDDVELHGQFFD